MNKNQDIPEGIDPEILEMINAMCAPNSPEFEQLHQFANKFGAKGMLEMIRAGDECLVDSLIANMNCGSQAPKVSERMLKALAASEVYLIYNNGPMPCSLMSPSAGLVVMAFTRECHVNKFIEENISEAVTIKKVSIADMFLKIIPERHFTLHVNAVHGGGMFEIVVPNFLMNYLYNLSVHGEEAIRRFSAETGNNPAQVRY